VPLLSAVLDPGHGPPQCDIMGYSCKGL
jgi:hypothetical protein